MSLGRRNRKGYFKREPWAPAPLSVTVSYKVPFSDIDCLNIVWHGRYPVYFEKAAAELGRQCGLSYRDYWEANLRAPIVQFHIDYLKPLFLEDVFYITAKLIWNEGARLNTEYYIHKENNQLVVTGYSIQMLIDGVTGEPCLIIPSLLEICRNKWRQGRLPCQS